MTTSHQRITVSTVPIALNTAGTSGGTLYIRCETNGVDIGGSTVAAGQGLPIAAAAALPWPIELGPGDVLFAIRSGATDAVVSVVRT
jgi:hypothetical protein